MLGNFGRKMRDKKIAGCYIVSIKWLKRNRRKNTHISKAQIQSASEETMSIKFIFPLLAMLTIVAILAGCGTAPAVTDQIPTTATQLLPATATEIPPTVAVDTPTVVITEMAATSIEPMLGSWSMTSPQGDTLYFLFKSDGTYEATRADGPKNAVPYRAKFWMDSGVLYVEGVCGDDVAMHQGKYEAPTITQRDGVNYIMKAAVIEDPCKDRVHDFGRGYVWSIPQP